VEPIFKPRPPPIDLRADADPRRARRRDAPKPRRRLMAGARAALSGVGGVFAWIFALAIAVGILAAGGGGLFVYQMSRGLPDYAQLASYQPPVMTRLHAADGRVFADYAVERRIFVPLEAVPARLVEAFISAEDKTFWTHPGLSVPDIVRAAVTNAQNWGRKRPVGASTITQQVAKNLLLSNEVSIERKVKEALLALRIEEALPKRRIMELYVNEIYLGFQAYGVAAASLMYFGKPLDELDLHEMAFLAALPKAPNNYNPLRFPERARERRDWVLGRMLEDGKITQAEHAAARAAPIAVRGRGEAADVARADHFAEEVRRELLARFGEEQLYKGGLSVRTSLDPDLQRAAEAALRRGMVEYDRRHGWRGAPAEIELGAGWERRLGRLRFPGTSGWRPAAVLSLHAERAEIGFADGSRGTIPFDEMRWARRTLDDQRVGPLPRGPADIVRPGDVVLVEALPAPAPAGRFALRQVPDVSGAVVALEPATGRVRAMVGGWSFEVSQFNRATQALRQPGSAFKPLIFLAALESGAPPNAIVLDAPLVIDQGPESELWKPGNYSGTFYGPTPLRVGVEQSRNLMTVRLAMDVGLDAVVRKARDFGVNDRMMPVLSAALGSIETTVIRLTSAYAPFVNGGYRVTPTLIDRVQDRNGKTIYRSDGRDCPDCRDAGWEEQTMPRIADPRRRVTDELSAYQMASILEGVVERGTGTRARVPGHLLAGKTGTTNDSVDAWFVGFSADLVVGVWIGFDSPRTLGPRETGGVAAVPIFQEVMAHWLKGRPLLPFRVPDAMQFATVDAETGRPATRGKLVLEAFKPGQEPDAPPPAQAAGGAPGRPAPTTGPAAARPLPAPVPAPAGGASSGIY
jgi:penicillin-binding protein 1A